MKLDIKNDPAYTKLVQLSASKNRSEAMEAQAQITKQVGPVLEKVLSQERVLTKVFKDFTYAEGDNPTIPLDLYYNHTTENEVRVWTQSTPGGLATNFMSPIDSEIHFRTFTLTSAISFDAKHARQGRTAVVSRSLEKLAQEFLLKEENIGSKILLKVLADNYVSNVVDSVSTSSKLQVADFNALMLRAARTYKSWAGGTTPDASQTITNMFISPERMADLRAMAYNPINSLGANQVTGTANSGVVTLPESARAGLFSAAGLASFYGVALTPYIEFGPGQKLTRVFGELLSTAGGTWNADDDIMLGFDMSKDFAYRAIATDGVGSTVSLNPDDQFLSRQQKIGFWGEEEVGYMVLDKRPIVGIRIKSA